MPTPNKPRDARAVTDYAIQLVLIHARDEMFGTLMRKKFPGISPRQIYRARSDAKLAVAIDHVLKEESGL